MVTTTQPSGTGAYYIRVSTDQQDTERQKEAIHRWLTTNRLAVPDQFQFEDNGFERDRPDLRPEFQRMLKCAEAGLFRWIVADRRDRFGTRDKYQFISFMHRLRECGCLFVTVDDKCWTDDGMMAFFEGGMSAETSQLEQKEKFHRVLQGKLLRAKRGEWQGGHVAYGLDVACYRPDGSEKWRVVLKGRKLIDTKPGKGGKPRRVYSLRRLKMTPDGQTEEFSGHRAFPATEVNEVLRLTPSKDQARLAVVREVFEKFAYEAISPTVLAARLNTLGVEPYYADRWEHYHVREMLKNPIYIGYQRWNSNGQGRFHEFVGGKERAVKNPGGRRERSKEDWVLSDDRLFEPIIPLDVWEKVQAKVDLNPPERRSPRSSDLWLAGLLYCSNCGQPMRGMQRPTRSEYFCSTYAKNKGECLRNCINHDDIERYIKRHLAETGQEVAALLDAQDTGNLELLQPFHDKHFLNLCRFGASLLKMTDMMVKHKDWEQVLQECGAVPGARRKPPETLDEFHTHMTEFLIPVERAYKVYLKRDESALRERLQYLDVEHTALTNHVLNFDPVKGKKAIEKANVRIEGLEAQMRDIEGRLTDVTGEFLKARDEMYAHSTAMFAAQKALNDPEANNRRKAQAVRACIQQINLTFRPTGKKYPKSELVKVEVIPATRHSPEHPNRASCCRGPTLPESHFSGQDPQPAT